MLSYFYVNLGLYDLKVNPIKKNIISVIDIFLKSGLKIKVAANVVFFYFADNWLSC